MFVIIQALNETNRYLQQLDKKVRTFELLIAHTSLTNTNLSIAHRVPICEQN